MKTECVCVFHLGCEFIIDYDGCVQLRYSYRLDPTPAQRTALGRALGCARAVFNDALAARKAAFEAGEPYCRTPHCRSG
jgi:helix-turn-helix protein